MPGPLRHRSAQIAPSPRRPPSHGQIGLCQALALLSTPRAPLARADRILACGDKRRLPKGPARTGRPQRPAAPPWSSAATKSFMSYASLRRPSRCALSEKASACDTAMHGDRPGRTLSYVRVPAKRHCQRAGVLALKVRNCFGSVSLPHRFCQLMKPEPARAARFEGRPSPTSRH